MPDIYDRADELRDLLQSRQDDYLAARLASREASIASFEDSRACDECGDEIEPPRLAIVPGCLHCASCAHELDWHNSRRRR